MARLSDACGRLWLLAFLMFVGTAVTSGQPASPPFRIVPFEELTVNVDVPHVEDTSVFSETVGVEYGTWIIVRFRSYNIGDGTLTITSLEDPSQEQVFTQNELEKWGGISARFSGGSVRIVVSSTESGGQYFYKIEDVIVGDEQGSTTPGIVDEKASSPESLGGQDDRTRSFDDRIARIMPVGCTAFSLNNGVFLTAGHCVTEGMLVLEFRVPHSLSNGAPVPPLVEHQFRVSPASILYSAKGPGRDWAVFSVHENDDGLQPHQIYGAFDFTIEELEGRIAVRGYGKDNGVDNLTQQHDYGDMLSFYRYWTRTDTPAVIIHNAGTHKGSSGSPIFYVDASGKIVGIHTHGDEEGFDETLENRGTSIVQTNLYQAIAARARGSVNHLTRIAIDQRLDDDSGAIEYEISHESCFSRIYWWTVTLYFSDDDPFDPGEALRVDGFRPVLFNDKNASRTSWGVNSIWPQETNTVIDGAFRGKLTPLIGSVFVSEIESRIMGHVVPCE